MKVCVTSYVFGTYKKFIPFFCYSVVRSYPDYHIRIFVDGELDEIEKESIADIKKNVSGNVDVVEHALEDVTLPDKPILRGGQKILRRWMFEQSDFEGFDCVYFSDIDFLVLAQEPPLAEFHTENARRIGLPFSNMVRADKANTGVGSRRLSGLHFVLSDEYFPRVDPYIRELKRDTSLIADRIPYATADEHLLFYVVDSGIGLDSESLCRAPRPVPGIHLSWSRNPRLLGQRTARLLRPYRGSIPYFRDVPGQLRSFCQDPVFLQMLWRRQVPEIVVILGYMGIGPQGVMQRMKFTKQLLNARAGFWKRVIQYKLGMDNTAQRG